MNTDNINMPLVIVVGLLALALILFLIFRNKRDRKKHLPPQVTDPVDTEKTLSERKRNLKD